MKMKDEGGVQKIEVRKSVKMAVRIVSQLCLARNMLLFTQ